jgi:hypothetical protein
LEHRKEVAELREQLRRYQFYLGLALAAFGVGTLLGIGLVGFYGFRLADELSKAEERISELERESGERTSELSREVARQAEEIAAIERAALDDLEAIREANRKLAKVKDPSRELDALREANEALWTELANQRAELLETLRGREVSSVSPPRAGPRFRLGETRFVDPAEDPRAIRGFQVGSERVFRATGSAKPVSLLIDLEPDGVRPGDPFRLSVRLVNHSNRVIAVESLRIDWSFHGKKTGGRVPLAVGRVSAQETGVVYSFAGDWTEAHELGPVSVTAGLTIEGGASVTNVLSW